MIDRYRVFVCDCQHGLGAHVDCEKDNAGTWARYEDCTALAAENAELIETKRHQYALLTAVREELKNVKAGNERLREAVNEFLSDCVATCEYCCMRKECSKIKLKAALDAAGGKE